MHDCFDKSGFSATVLTYYTDLVPTFYNCIYLTERLVVAENELVQNNRFFNRFALGLEVGFESCRVKVARRADFAYTFDLFEFCLRHGGFFCLVSESFNKCAKPIDLFFAHNRILESLVVRLLFLRRKRGVVALISLRFAVLDFVYDIYDFIQKHTVVRHYHTGFFVCAKIVFKPLDSLQIQVVGRLVQKQNVGF